MVSPSASPQKKKLPGTGLEATRRVSGHLTAEGTASAAAALGIHKMEHQQSSAGTSISRRTGMLPTPAKTPQKAPTEKNARNLFPTEDAAMPSPKKRKPKKYTGISMDSFTAEEVEEPIAIFTDSHDRVPTIDVTDANPFYGDAQQHQQPSQTPEPTKRRSKRNRVVVPGEGVQTVDEALGREDGLVYVL
jgi:hypothetical protein